MPRNIDVLLAEYKRTLGECRNLYVHSAQFCATHHPDLVPESPGRFVRLLDDLHRGLLVKTYFAVAEADRVWRSAEREFGRELILHVWGKLLDDADLKQTMFRLSEQATSLKWYGLVRPFTEIEPLRDRIGQLETIVIRSANLVAKADGKLTEAEAKVLHSLQEQLDSHLRAIPYADQDHESAQQYAERAVSDLHAGASQFRTQYELHKANQPPRLPKQVVNRPSLEDARKELDALIGLEGIKREIGSLINYLKLQRNRAKVGLPETPLSLHSLFTGNPGTGKTTVARIVGQILGAMQILDKGHVVETDRSGLVAEFAGQTGPKTNKKVDEALDGILFVDEAYTLIADGNEDPYGHEAVQALLKRMEDDRDRLVVVLAGYPGPMDRLMDSNPGLRSRFSRRIHFEDYSPIDLGRILEYMCSQNEYVLQPETRAKFLLGMSHLFKQRDEHFGNGRFVRNLFEDSIRQLANRIVSEAPLTRELLTHVLPDDIQFPTVPVEILNIEVSRFRVRCAGCDRSSEVPTSYLSKRVDCPCGTRFRIDWGEVVE